MRDGSKLRSVKAKNNTYDVMSGKVGEYTILLIKSRNIEKGDFLVSTVSINGKIIWSFKKKTLMVELCLWIWMGYCVFAWYLGQEKSKRLFLLKLL